MVFDTNGARFTNNVRLNGASIDVRTIGGYIILCPAPIAAGSGSSRSPSHWPRSPTPLPPTSAPSRRLQHRPSPSQASSRHMREPRLMARAKAIETAENGEQEATLNRECFSIGGLAGGGALDHDTAIARLVEAAFTACRPMQSRGET